MGGEQIVYEGTGNVPPGLTLSSSGVLSGTPTTQGSYIFHVSVTGETSGTGNTFNYSMVIS